ncbi:cobalamin B12-binding domain-containing protein [Roseinatronobacter sp. NSM]|uniref:cobalamin B12-binding domain-containing protein n=1 Tax=Roseinatronobacter sp. NSM TaxID=3457785 RepID=UPI004036BA5F
MDKSLYQGCASWLQHGLQALGHDIGQRATSMNIAASAQPAALHKLAGKSAAVPVEDLHLALLQGELARALEICRAFRAAQRHDRASVYARLLLPVIAQLGRDWSEDRASFEDVAFAYSLMHRIIETLGESDTPNRRGQGGLHLGRVIVAVAPGDAHDFGARVLVKHLQLQGWDAQFVDGASTREIMPLLQAGPVDALAISVGTDSAFIGLADMISEWRYAQASQHTEVIVGGAAIVPPFGHYSFLQADQVGLRINEMSEHLLSQMMHGRYGRWSLS